MIRHWTLPLFAALAAVSAPAMTYAPARPIGSVTFPQPTFSTCSTSPSIAVGIDYSSGIRILCADAGDIGFWTTPLPAQASGQASSTRMLCQSSFALAGLMFIEGVSTPFPLCAPLIPNLHSGGVTRPQGKFLTVDGRSFSATDVGVSGCPDNQYVQSLRLANGSASAVCNAILTTPVGSSGFAVDLAARTLRQRQSLSSSGVDNFFVEVFNLGIESVPASAVHFDVRFNTFAWTLAHSSNIVCTALTQRVGLVDIRSVGMRCTIPGAQLDARGSSGTILFQLQPIGSSALRPPTTSPVPVLSVNAILDEATEGADPNTTNNLAAFPVTIN